MRGIKAAIQFCTSPLAEQRFAREWSARDNDNRFVGDATLRAGRSSKWQREFAVSILGDHNHNGCALTRRGAPTEWRPYSVAASMS